MEEGEDGVTYIYKERARERGMDGRIICICERREMRQRGTKNKVNNGRNKWTGRPRGEERGMDSRELIWRSDHIYSRGEWGGRLEHIWRERERERDELELVHEFRGFECGIYNTHTHT